MILIGVGTFCTTGSYHTRGNTVCWVGGVIAGRNWYLNSIETVPVLRERINCRTLMGVPSVSDK